MNPLDRLKDIFKRRRPKEKEETQRPRVKLYIDFATHSPPHQGVLYRWYDVELDPETLEPITTNIRADLGLPTLMVEGTGMRAVNWSNSSLRPVDVTLKAEITYVLNDVTVKKTVNVKNNSPLEIDIPLGRWVKLDGIIDGGYFYMRHIIPVEVVFHPVDNVGIAYRYSPDGFAIGYSEEQRFTTSVTLQGLVKIKKEEKVEKPDIDDRPTETVVRDRCKIIRTVPAVKNIIDELKQSYAEVTPTGQIPQTPHLVVVLDPSITRTAAYVAVSVNNNPLLLYSDETPVYRAVTSVEYGNTYDIDVRIVIDGAIYPPAIIKPILTITQSRRYGEGWLYERTVATVIGDDDRRLGTSIPIGLTSYRLHADKPDRSYTITVSAEKSGPEQWVLRGRVRREENNIVFEDIQILTKLGEHSEPIQPEWPVTMTMYIYGIPMDGYRPVLRSVEFDSNQRRLVVEGLEDEPDSVAIRVEGIKIGKYIWSLAHVIEDIEYEGIQRRG